MILGIIPDGEDLVAKVLSEGDGVDYTDVFRLIANLDSGRYFHTSSTFDIIFCSGGTFSSYHLVFMAHYPIYETK